MRCVGGSVATSNNGNVYVSWSGITNTLPFREDFAGFATSTDGGDNWNFQQNIFDMNGISGTLESKEGIKVNGLPQVAVDNSGGVRDGWIYIVTTELNIAPAGSDPDIILHHSTDNGQTWSAGIRVNQDPLNNGKIQYFPSLEIDDEGGLNILFYDDRNTTSDSTDVFLSRSTNGGNTWGEFSIKNSRFKPKPILGGASAYQGDHIALLSVGDKLHALWMADYSGIYQVWLATIDRNILSVEDNSNSTVNEFALFQNYPNPFNPSTRINYSIGKESFVQLKVYDVLGNEVATLVNEEKPAGTYDIRFTSDKLPSGIYFYRLSANNFSETKKLII
ncbi:MAG: T9SS type A sorting domain-containing protein, partial [Ignavibacteriaceae bacterium]